MTRTWWIALLTVASSCALAHAQEAPSEELLERIRKLEAQVEALQGEPEEPKTEDKEEGFRFDPEAAEEAEKEAGEESEEDEEDESPLALELPLSMKLTFTGRLRVRTELRTPADYRLPGTFGRPATDEIDDNTDFTLLRTRIGFTLDVVESVRAVVEIQDSRTFGDVAVGADRAEFHLYSGYIDIYDPFDVPLDVRVGRMPVPDLGDARLISALDFSNVGRSWDGAQVIYRPDGFWLSAFVANIREGAIFSADGDENDDFTFAGIYASVRLIEDHEFDAYVFWRHLSDRVFTSELGRTGDRKDFTFGFRMKGKAGPLGYSGEFDWQEGDQAGDRISTYAGAARVWVKLDLGDDMAFRVLGEYSYAKGDRDPLDSKEETFDPLLPFAHFYHGFSDLIGWRNVHTGMLGVAFWPMKTLSFHADAHVFLLDKRKDAWYTFNKTPVRIDPTGGAHSHIGTELDLFFKAKLWDRLYFMGGYSHFFDGPFVRATGPSTDQGWWNMQVELKF